MKEFMIAAKQAVENEDGEEPNVREFGLAGQSFRAKLPTSGQVSLVAGSTFGTNSEFVSSVYNFLRAVLLDDGYTRLRKLVADGTVPFEVLFGGDDNNDHGIVEWLSREATGGRPTSPSSDSSPSPEGAGRRSTGRSPGKGSTRST